jgi:hypothetical protein
MIKFWICKIYNRTIEADYRIALYPKSAQKHAFFSVRVAYLNSKVHELSAKSFTHASDFV